MCIILHDELKRIARGRKKLDDVESNWYMGGMNSLNWSDSMVKRNNVNKLFKLLSEEKHIG